MAPAPKRPETHGQRAFKFRLDPTPAQEVLLAKHAGTARWAFNFALDIKHQANQRYHSRRKDLVESGMTPEEATKAMRGKVRIPGAYDVAKMWQRVRGDDRVREAGESPWWHEVSSYAFKESFAQADRAYQNYFDSVTGKRKGPKMGRPRFKKKGRCADSFKLFHDSSAATPGIRLEGYRRVRLPRIGSVRTFDPRYAKTMSRLMKRTDGFVTSASVSRAGNKWYVSLLVNIPTEKLPEARPTRRMRTHGDVGVDLGVSLMAATSDGVVFDRLKPARDAHKRLVSAQRALSRTKRGSANRVKAARRVARLHHAVALKRAGAQHQLTKYLTTTYETVAIEDLRVSSMTRSAKGTVEAPGRNVRAKSGLNRSMLDVGFAEIRRQLEYKSDRYGSTVVAVNPAYTSRTCSACGHVAQENRKSQADFRCVACGHTANADVNAAINIRERARLARPENGEIQPLAQTRGSGVVPTAGATEAAQAALVEVGASTAGKPAARPRARSDATKRGASSSTVQNGAGNRAALPTRED